MTKRGKGQGRGAGSGRIPVADALNGESAEAAERMPEKAILVVPPALADLINQIKAAHRDRCFAMEQRKRADLSLGSFLRMVLGWRKDLPEKERKAIAAEAARLQKGDVESVWSEMIRASHSGKAQFEEVEKDRAREMERLAKQLPAWGTFGVSVRGFGPLGLAIIVAEAGDLDEYASHSKLWKRMGLAVIDGARQGIVSSGLTGAARSAAWISHGYSPVRRSRMFTIGDALLKGNGNGPYRAAYAHRRAWTQKTHPEWWLDAKGESKLNKQGMPSSSHGHNDAQRYMEKRLLRDLWRAWRGATCELPERARKELPLSSASAATNVWME